MGERTSYPPGTFSWAELATTDAEAAKAFYTALLGWTYEDNPVTDGSTYSMALRDGHYVAALFGASDQPPHWNCYVTVESADETAAKARGLGGTVMAEPFEVLDVGRMAVVADPNGAAVCLWEPRQHVGASLVNAPGALTWVDLVTPDPEAAERFYGGLFGWTFPEMADSGGYRLIRVGERSTGGILPQPEGPPTWIPYFGHEDVDRATGEIAERGGRVLNGPLSVPNGGRIAVVTDPQGALLALWTGPYDD